MAKGDIYQVNQSKDNPAHFSVVKLTQDYEAIETYHISVLAPHSMICTCPAGTRSKCRHRTMVTLFKSKNLVGKKWSYEFDKDKWIAPLGALEVDDEQ